MKTAATTTHIGIFELLFGHGSDKTEKGILEHIKGVHQNTHSVGGKYTLGLLQVCHE